MVAFFMLQGPMEPPRPQPRLACQMFEKKLWCTRTQWGALHGWQARRSLLVLNACCKAAICNKWPDLNNCTVQIRTVLRAYEDKCKIRLVHKAACLAKSVFQVDQTIITHYYIIVPSLLLHFHHIITYY